MAELKCNFLLSLIRPVPDAHAPFAISVHLVECVRLWFDKSKTSCVSALLLSFWSIQLFTLWVFLEMSSCRTVSYSFMKLPMFPGCWQECKRGAGEILQWWRTLAALYRTWVHVSAPTWCLTADHNSNSKGSDMFFQPLQVMHTYSVLT